MGHSPILCYVTDRHLLSKSGCENVLEILLRKIEEAVSAKLDWIQIREKALAGRDAATLAHKALQHATTSSKDAKEEVRIIVNDRLDVAIAERAGGVHLGERSLPAAAIRRFVGSRTNRKDFLIGVSCHSLEGARAAEDGGASYVFFGPVFTTPSKAGYGAPQGLERLAEICRAVSIPVIAIGGVTAGNAGHCLAAGAAGIAAIRLFQEAADMASLAMTLRKSAR